MKLSDCARGTADVPVLRVDLCAGLERRPERTDRTKAVADTSLERLFRREDVPVREKCLWRLLYETAARVHEVLSLNVEDLDLDNKRACTISKGGDTEWLHFQSGSARLLPRVIAGRQSGPLFLADRRPAPARTPAALDVCPITGRGRLSYKRAEYLFKRHSRRISRNGLTLHQLRHSALATLADANVSPATADGAKAATRTCDPCSATSTPAPKPSQR